MPPGSVTGRVLWGGGLREANPAGSRMRLCYAVRVTLLTNQSDGKLHGTANGHWRTANRQQGHHANPPAAHATPFPSRAHRKYPSQARTWPATFSVVLRPFQGDGGKRRAIRLIVPRSAHQRLHHDARASRAQEDLHRWEEPNVKVHDANIDTGGHHSVDCVDLKNVRERAITRSFAFADAECERVEV